LIRNGHKELSYIFPIICGKTKETWYVNHTNKLEPTILAIDHRAYF
jgi:hypothetical protein